MDELDRALRKLPRDVAPRRDLWPGIAADFDAPAKRWPSQHSARRAGIAAAAAIAIAAVGLRLAHVTSDAPADALANLLPAAYLHDREQLLRGFPTEVAALPPESRADVERDLATVRQALEDLGTALRADSASPLLQELFINTCQDEMRLLLAVREAATHDRGV